MLVMSHGTAFIVVDVDNDWSWHIDILAYTELGLVYMGNSLDTLNSLVARSSEIMSTSIYTG